MRRRPQVSRPVFAFDPAPPFQRNGENHDRKQSRLLPQRRNPHFRQDHRKHLPPQRPRRQQNQPLPPSLLPPHPPRKPPSPRRRRQRHRRRHQIHRHLGPQSRALPRDRLHARPCPHAGLHRRPRHRRSRRHAQCHEVPRRRSREDQPAP